MASRGTVTSVCARVCVRQVRVGLQRPRWLIGGHMCDVAERSNARAGGLDECERGGGTTPPPPASDQGVPGSLHTAKHTHGHTRLVR